MTRARQLVLDLLGLGLLVVGAVVLALRTHAPPADQVLAGLTIWTLAAAVIVLAAVSWLSGDADTGRLACTLAVCAMVLLPLRDADLPLGDGGKLMLAAVTLAGFVGILHLGRHTQLVAGQFAVVVVAMVAAVLAAAGATFIGSAPTAAGAVTLGAACIAAMFVAVDHLCAGSALRRRTGVALVAFTVASALRTVDGTPFGPALELAGAGLLLWASAAGWMLVLRTIWGAAAGEADRAAGRTGDSTAALLPIEADRR